MEKGAFDLQEFLPYRLNQAAEAASLGFQKVYRERYGMLRTEWRVLFHLGLYGSMTAREIGARAGIHKTKISRAVSRLEAQRFLTRKRDEADRRVENLSLTPNGRRVYDDLFAVAERYEGDLTAALSTDERALLRDLLRRIETAGQAAIRT
ncbi:MarR family transcriptional regulator [Thalassococcus sp. CAU 1522]|uniref:MarR family transcriptional regulator n=1 Tax=Thalassococcus arenae TaxID=2851652 RepID=A0ABS6N6T9_9RHOB|nr:MarR family transcriptional regulator [Thalassococcus arenae]MBV2359733.1 MarR family transcriptional regulator [Thalassococcus arenae]